MEMNFELFPIDDLLRGPRDGNARADRGHDDKVAIRAALQVTDVAIVREDFWPELEVRRRFKDRHLRRVDENGISGVHGGGNARANPPGRIKLARKLCNRGKVTMEFVGQGHRLASEHIPASGALALQSQLGF